ncbi:flagellin N-terminal-like domain-containing protein [Halogranum gelatinilyticum]|uniref:Flagellin N-terminal-like domain-containing protein n=1 Tax=Halogranum gelatinilyticum TaxID=660521 RepID=A0A1G9R584_9EURY|nr:archaellin/type IV pilin N-terminal domain-containing protein [Halogranum gelatinilyticum]SDM18404.1 flagellin N-terminal-like domain-containing protein [Halogranum gelatinilyticum]
MSKENVRRAHTNRPAGEGRGQSDVIGVVLLLAITVLGAGTIVALGSQTLADSEHQLEVESAEHAMTEFDSRTSLVAHGDSPSQEVALPGGSGSTVSVEDDTGRMLVTVSNGGSVREIMNRSFGSVAYRNGDETIAYQGGGVWRQTTSGSTMVSPPEFHYRDKTLTLPLVVPVGDGTLGSRAQITRAGEPVPKFPLPNAANADERNPLGSGEVHVIVESDYYRAWGRFFEERTGGTVSYDDSNQRVTLTLVVPGSSPAVSGGIVSGGAGGSLHLANGVVVDSYNSSIGDGTYATSAAKQTSIIAAGDVTMSNKATVEGDLETGGSIWMSNQALITGNLSYTGTVSKANKAEVNGWERQNADIPELESVEWVIDERRAAAKNTTTTDDDYDAANDQLVCDSDCTLESGLYYFDDLHLWNEEVVLDTTNGDIEIVVDGSVGLSGDTSITVKGDGVARLYVENSYHQSNQGTVDVPAQRSPQFWVYLNPNGQAGLANQARFEGVIYGPGTGDESGAQISVSNQAQVYGGLVGQVPNVPNGVGIHFDEALKRENPLEGYGSNAPKLTYLHVSVSEVNVTAT